MCWCVVGLCVADVCCAWNAVAASGGSQWAIRAGPGCRVLCEACVWRRRVGGRGRVCLALAVAAVLCCCVPAPCTAACTRSALGVGAQCRRLAALLLFARPRSVCGRALGSNKHALPCVRRARITSSSRRLSTCNTAQTPRGAAVARSTAEEAHQPASRLTACRCSLGACWSGKGVQSARGFARRVPGPQLSQYCLSQPAPFRTLAAASVL